MVMKIHGLSFAVVLHFILFIGICTISFAPLSHATEEDLAAANECPQDDHGSAECTSSSLAAKGENDLFYAWDMSADMPLVNALFPSPEFAAAWERHPLLSRVSFTEKQNLNAPADQIPTILHNRSLVPALKQFYNEPTNIDEDPILSLISVDGTLSIISQPRMTHGSDYKLVKKIVREGEEFMGMLPNPSYSIQEVLQHFHLGAFSLVVNKMQKRSYPVAKMARVLEEELGVLNVGVNLYLTPEVVIRNERDLERNGVVRQGFESHWDWMDVIVIQLSGRKRWSVAQEPTVYLSSKDQKHKPKKDELAKFNPYSDFTLCPGDILYIPRGHIHNASTVLFDNLPQSSDKDKIDLDNCPSYPKGSESGDLLSSLLIGPSLHLTFGLLQSNDATVETLLHHALDIFFAANSSHDNVAIPSKTCYGAGRAVMKHDIQWKSVLHHVLAEVARRDHPCDSTYSHIHSDTTNLGRCDGTAILRKSVPLLLLERNNLIEAKSTRQYSNLKKVYQEALGAFQVSASVPKTVDFIKTLLFEPPSDEELIFHYPGYIDKDVIYCPDVMMSLPADAFKQLMQSFDQYATANFPHVLKEINQWGQKRRKEDRQRQADMLSAVGQKMPV